LVADLRAYLTDAEWLVAVPALQLAVGVTVGRRFCLPCLVYIELLRPDLARGYGIRTTPVVVAARLRAGQALETFRDEPRRHELERLRALTAA
jgi:hypothetical protein